MYSKSIKSIIKRIEIYFSDKEKGTVNRISENISIEVRMIYFKFMKNLNPVTLFRQNFLIFVLTIGRAGGFDNALFEDRLKSEIPNIEVST